VSLEELKRALLPNYLFGFLIQTSYYKRNWGFYLSYKQYLELQDEEYEVCIDSSLESGHLTYGESLIRVKAQMRC